MEEGYLSTMNYLEVFINDEVTTFKQLNRIYGFDYHIFGKYNLLWRKICSLQQCMKQVWKNPKRYFKMLLRGANEIQ